MDYHRECLSIHLNTNLEPVGDTECPYHRDWVTIHGDPADIRLLVQKIAEALPPVEESTESYEASEALQKVAQ